MQFDPRDNEMESRARNASAMECISALSESAVALRHIEMREPKAHQFVSDIIRRMLADDDYSPTPKQLAWLKSLKAKYVDDGDRGDSHDVGPF